MSAKAEQHRERFGGRFYIVKVGDRRFRVYAESRAAAEGEAIARSALRRMADREASFLEDPRNFR